MANTLYVYAFSLKIRPTCIQEEHLFRHEQAVKYGNNINIPINTHLFTV